LKKYQEMEDSIKKMNNKLSSIGNILSVKETQITGQVVATTSLQKLIEVHKRMSNVLRTAGEG